jgi:uncharacterized protein YodC (DUF2158 family)
MPTTRKILTVSFSMLTFMSVPTASAQVAGISLSDPPAVLSSSNPTAESTDKINKEDLKRFQPSVKEKILRAWQYQFQLQEQPAFIVASSGGTSSTLPNPNKWLQQHSITLTLSELFPKVTNLSELVGAAYDMHHYNHPTNAKVQLDTDICHGKDKLKCLVRGGDFSAGNFFERLFSGASVTFSESQRDEFQQGMIVPLSTSQGWAFGYVINFNPASLFVTSANWTKVNTVLAKRQIDLGDITPEEKNCIVADGPAKGRNAIGECEDLFAKPRLYASNRQSFWTGVAAVMIPTFKMQALSQFDFLKQGGILVQSPLLQRTLKNFTFTWDLGRLLPATSDKIAVEQLYYQTPKAQNEGEIKTGNVVELKSGGPDMTVDSVENNSGTAVAACSWFLNNQKESGRFPVATLKLVSE